jgi:hypothetical protein
LSEPQKIRRYLSQIKNCQLSTRLSNDFQPWCFDFLYSFLDSLPTKLPLSNLTRGPNVTHVVLLDTILR